MGLAQAKIVRNYVQFNNRPFTTSDLEKATGVNRKISAGVLKQLVTAGTVKILRTQNRRYVYVRRPHAGGVRPSVREQILTYARACEKPFGVIDVRTVTGCTYPQAKYHLAELVKSGEISYVSLKAQVKHYVWGESEQSPQDTPTRLWQTIQDNPGASQSELIKLSGLSRSAVERWLRIFRIETLVSYDITNHNTYQYKNLVSELPIFKSLKDYGVR